MLSSTMTSSISSKIMERDVKDLPPMEETATSGHNGEMETLSRQHFNLWATLGINYSSIGTPLSIGTYLAFNIGVGGSPVYVYGYIVTLIFQLLVCLSLAELAAAFPHATGQVYWTHVLAPPKWAKGLSYWTGAFTAAAWFFWTCGTYLFMSQLLFALVSITHTSFAVEPYHVFLAYIVGGIVGVLLNTVLFKGYTYLLRAMVIYLNGAAVLFMVALLVRATPKRSAQTVFVDFVNATGWSSDGLVFLLGLLPGITAINGFDAATHVTDEVPNPRRQVPQVMIGTAVLAGLAGLPMTIVYMFCVVNEDNLLAPVGGQPFVQLIVDSCRSQGLTIALVVILVLLYLVACGTLTTTVSRVLWSLATDRHMFLSPWFAHVATKQQIPVNAICGSALLTVLFGLLILGPTTALSAIIGSAAVSFFFSYIIPLACALGNRSPLTATTRYIDLGKFGPFVNIIAVAWMTLMSVILMIPQYLPVTVAYMNYTVVVIAGVVVVYGINWLCYARTRYATQLVHNRLPAM